MLPAAATGLLLPSYPEKRNAYLPGARREATTETLAVVHFSDEKLSRPLAIIHRKGKQFSLAAERFIEFLVAKKPADEIETKSKVS